MRVVVVDPSRTVLKFIARLLATRNHEVRTFVSAREALEYIILMSCDRDQHKLIEALDSGADDFIGKPPAAEELYARLRSAERLANMQQDLLRLGIDGSPHRRAQSPGVLRKRAASLRARPDALRHRDGHRPFQAHQ